jgi:hypothetical protein
MGWIPQTSLPQPKKLFSVKRTHNKKLSRYLSGLFYF